MGDLPQQPPDDPRTPNGPPPDPPPRPESKSEPKPEKDPVEELKSEAAELRTQNLALKAQIDELKALTASGDQEPPKSLQHLHLLQIQPLRDLLVILLIVGVVYLGYILRPLTVPMLLALALAYLFEPVIRRMTTGKHIGRPFAAIAIIASMVLLVTVPATVGVTYGTVQGLHYGRQVQGSISVLQKSVQNPTDEALKDRVEQMGTAWKMIRAWFVGAEHAEASDKEGDETSGTAADSEGEPQTEDETPGEEEKESEGDAKDTPTVDEDLLITGEDQETEDTAAGDPPPSGSAASDRPPQVGQPPGTRETDAREFARDALAWLDGWLQRTAASFGATYGRQALGTGADALRVVWGFIAGSVYIAFASFLILFFFFFFSVNYQRVLNSLADLIPKWKRARTIDMIRKMDGVVSGFVRGRLIIMCIQTVMFIIGYWAIGVPAALVLGLIVGVLSLVPYLSLIGIPVSILLMWLQPDPPVWWWVVFAPIVIYFIVQMSDDYVWTPMIQGKATDMDVPSILFAVLAGGMLAGFYGVLLAIPAAACIKILLKEAFWPRFKAWSEGRVKDFLPISRYDPTSTGISPIIKKD